MPTSPRLSRSDGPAAGGSEPAHVHILRGRAKFKI
jgi:hypothetical protein